jgi:hypothetical protein
MTLLREYRIESPTDPATSYHAELLARDNGERFVYCAELHCFRVADIDALIELLQRVKADDRQEPA